MAYRKGKETIKSTITMLIANNISYKIKNKSLLKDINFELQPGELLAIVGPNGAGKSTLLKILSGELQKYTGSVLLNGQNLSSFNTKTLATKRAVLSQNISLTLPFIVSEIVMMGRYSYFDNKSSMRDKQIVEECLSQTGMLSFKDRNYLTLSGGEKQRVQLARVLAQLSENKTSKSEAKFLFLDEPVNGLDLKYQQQVMKIAKDWKGTNNSVVAVLHDLNLASQYADKILLLNNGTMEALDVPANVFTKENIKRVYDVDVNFFSQSKETPLYIAPAGNFKSSKNFILV